MTEPFRINIDLISPLDYDGDRPLTRDEYAALVNPHPQPDAEYEAQAAAEGFEV